MIFFNELNSTEAFPICYNLLPHFSAEKQQQAALLDFVNEALQDGRIHNFLLADHPSHPQEFSSLNLAKEIRAAGGDLLISLALTFNDRHALIQKLLEYHQIGVRHFIFVTGEYPPIKESNRQEPVFDLDSVQMLMQLEGMQKAAEIFKGCAVSPFKALESEQVWQYEKLKRKISVGADFVITQLGYDIRKFDELIQFCKSAHLTTPLVANIYLTDLAAAQMLQDGRMNGVTIPYRLLNTLSNEGTANQGKMEKSITRTAKLLAVLKGIGYHGALLGSMKADFTDIKKVLDGAAKLQTEWQNLLGDLDSNDYPYYYFQESPQKGLSSNKQSPVTPTHFPKPMHLFSYFVDWLVYVPHGPLYKITGRFCHFCNGRRFWYRFIWLQEFVAKRPLYGCKMCGDCVLYACGFLCYQSGCPKKMVNGPCGGSRDGFCEVFPDKICFWVKVYNNMKGVRQDVTYIAPPIPARDVSLDRTSSWINFFTGKDHRRIKFTID